MIGVQGFNNPGVTDESDFHNSLIPVTVGSIAWEKRDAAGLLLGGAQFTITPDPTDGVGILTILDNGPGDADPALGQILVNNAPPGTYTVTETVAPLGYVIDADPTRVVIVTVGNLTQVIGVQGFNDPGVTDESDFHNRKRRVIVIGTGKSPSTPQFVKVIDEESGAVLSQFAPYGNTFQGGVRVATGDLTGDGVDEIVTAPGWSIVAEVRVYTQNGGLLTSFQPYGSTFQRRRPGGGRGRRRRRVERHHHGSQLGACRGEGVPECACRRGAHVRCVASLQGFPRVPIVVYRRRGGCRGRHGKQLAGQRTVRQHAGRKGGNRRRERRRHEDHREGVRR